MLSVAGNCKDKYCVETFYFCSLNAQILSKCIVQLMPVAIRYAFLVSLSSKLFLIQLNFVTKHQLLILIVCLKCLCLANIIVERKLRQSKRESLYIASQWSTIQFFI